MSLITALDNRMNPIVVKELRQGFQNWFIIIVVNLLLVGLSVTCLLMVMINPDITEETTGGRDMFQFLQALLFIATVLGVPLYVLGRLRSERNGNQVDLFFTTTLQPQKIVRGKFIAGMSLVTLLYSVCLPFMLFTYFLRGYDVPTMLFSLGMGYLIVIPLIMLAIVVGTWGIPRIFALFVMAGALVGLIFVVWFLCLSSYWFLQGGIQIILRGGNRTIAVIFLILLFGFLVTKLLEAMAIALLSPPSSNRTCCLRVWTTISIFVYAVFGAGIIWYESLSGAHSTPLLRKLLEPAAIWAFICMACVAILLLIAICEPDRFSNRIMLQRPRNILVRMVIFPFIHGASNGILWAVIHSTAILGILYVMFLLNQDYFKTSGHYSTMKEDVIGFIRVFACFCAYALLAKLIMRIFCCRVPAKHTWATFLFVSVMFLVSSMLICFAIDPQNWDQMLFWKIFNPMADSSQLEAVERTRIDIFLVLAMLVICIPKTIRDTKRYLFEETTAEA